MIPCCMHEMPGSASAAYLAIAKTWLNVKSTANFVGITTNNVLKKPKQIAQPAQIEKP